MPYQSRAARNGRADDTADLASFTRLWRGTGQELWPDGELYLLIKSLAAAAERPDGVNVHLTADTVDKILTDTKLTPTRLRQLLAHLGSSGLLDRADVGDDGHWGVYSLTLPRPPAARPTIR